MVEKFSPRHIEMQEGARAEKVKRRMVERTFDLSGEVVSAIGEVQASRGLAAGFGFDIEGDESTLTISAISEVHEEIQQRLAGFEVKPSVDFDDADRQYLNRILRLR